MSRTRSLVNIRGDVIDRANIESASGTTAFLPTATINEYINQSYARLYNKLVKARGHEYFVASAPFNTSNGVDTYAIDATFFELLGVDVVIGGETYACLPFNFLSRNKYKTVGFWSPEYPVFYRLMGNNIKFIPTPTSVYACTVWFVPVCPRLTADGQTLDGVNGWEEWIVCDAAAKCLRKMGLDATDHIQAREDLTAEIEAMASNRDAANPETVTDVYEAQNYGYGWRRTAP